MFKRSLVLGIVAATTFSLAAAVPAFAGSGNQLPAPNGSAPTTANLSTSGASVSPNLVIGTGGTCYGQTDKPHNSTHVNGTMNVVARTVCPAQDYVETALYRLRWYGWEYLNAGNATRYGTAQDNVAYLCVHGDLYTYEGDSYHSASGAGYAYTSNSARFTCT